MADLQGFDANQVEPTSDFDPIPAGKYLAVITESEMKPTRNGDGRYLQFTFQILEGEHQGRYLWARLNLENNNETAVKIARSELSAVCRAVGVLTPKDSQDLHDLPLIISVKLRKRPDTGDLQNEIRGYEKKETAGPPAQQSTPSTPPWKRGA